MKRINFLDFNRDNSYNKYFVDIANETYIFILRWNTYCNCAFLNITDYYDNLIISGVALTNGLIIRNNKLPYIFYFVNLYSATYEPTIDNFSDEFALFFEEDEINVTY